MGTKTYNNYEDLITFTRASGGHALRPVSYGSQLVANGTFDSDSDWNKVQATISGGVCEINSPSGSYAAIYQEIPVTVGKVYFISVEVVSVVAGSVQCNVEGTTFLTSTTSGIITAAYVATGDTLTIEIKRAGGVTEFTIDNVSVKEVTFDEPDGTLTLFEHPNNVPRVEYDAVGNRLGLLVEEARTNLVTYSEDFSQSSWVKLGGGVASAAVVTGGFVSPTGTNTATRLQCDLNGGASSGDQSLIYDDLAGTGNHSMSFWVKSNTGSNQTFAFGNSLAAFTTGVATNEWQRFTYSANLSPNRNIFIGARGSIGTDDTLDILIFGAQQELGAFPTSYIKTTGSTATRSADVASIPVADFGFNADEGTVVCEVQHFTTESSSAHALFGFDDGSSNNRMWYYQNKGQWIGSVSGSTTFSVDATDPTEGVETKVGVTYKKDDFTLYLNGSSVGTDTSSDVPIVDTLNIGKTASSNTELNGHIKSIKYFPRRLTNAQLVDLTS